MLGQSLIKFIDLNINVHKAYVYKHLEKGGCHVFSIPHVNVLEHYIRAADSSDHNIVIAPSCDGIAGDR